MTELLSHPPSESWEKWNLTGEQYSRLKNEIGIEINSCLVFDFDYPEKF